MPHCQISINKRFHISKIIGLFSALGLSLVILVGLLGCSGLDTTDEDIAPLAFNAYQQQTVSDLKKHRVFQQLAKKDEVFFNAPNEWRPSSLPKDRTPDKGILLVHGLGDSPWSFSDIAQVLAEEGFLVRTVLLPGHGTTPNDMLDVSAEQWQLVVHQQAKQLEMDVLGDVYLGGFSTGANLILDYAYQHPSIAGLALFSPGFKSSLPFQWVTPALSKVRPWLMTSSSDVATQTPVRYMAMPTNGFAQFYRTSLLAQKLLEKPYDKPVIMVAAEHDSVIDTQYLLKVFQTTFTNPESRLIWYGNYPNNVTDDSRILVRTDRIEDQRISQFSHMGLLFSPDNVLYGSEGGLRICMNSLDDDEIKACEDGAETWFSAWGYQKEGKIHARLTFNPYFLWQNSIMVKVLGS
ncbi:alpha/beta hydrolase [Vibrio alginolyticus]